MKVVEMLSLVGRKVVVTGAASGIGLAIAARVAEAGAEVVLIDVDEEGLAEALLALADSPATASTYALDLASKEQIDQFWASLEATPPDTLINNAGVYSMEDFLEMDEAGWSRFMAVNLESMAWMCQAFIGQRLKQGGTIVNVSSIEALLPFTKHLVPYSVSKAGVIALTRALARDYGKQGFRVNTILPGGIHTPGTKGMVKQALRTMDLGLASTGYNFQQRLAMGRWGQPDEVARVALFLISELASYVQGALIPVDGGFLSS